MLACVESSRPLRTFLPGSTDVGRRHAATRQHCLRTSATATHIRRNTVATPRVVCVRCVESKDQDLTSIGLGIGDDFTHQWHKPVTMFHSS